MRSQTGPGIGVLLMMIMALAVYRLAPAVSSVAQRSVWDGVYTSAQADRGESVYRRECTYCHGAFLQGSDSPNGPPLTGIRFITRWRGRTVGELLGTIATMPAGTHVVGGFDPPTAEVASSVVSYILQENGMPSGETPLPFVRSTLEQIVISEAPSR